MLQILRGDENLLQKGYTCTFGDKIPEDNIRDETDTCRKQKSVSNVHVHLELETNGDINLLNFLLESWTLDSLFMVRLKCIKSVLKEL